MIDCTLPFEIDGGRPVRTWMFSSNGEYLMSGDDEAVRVWRIASGEEVGTMTAHDVRSLAVSDDGKWIAAGTELGRIIVWNAHTYRRIFSHKENGSTIRAVNFSPDSSRLVTASSNCTTSIWEVGPSACSRVLGPLHHKHGVIAAKYSPQGDRIATYAGLGPIQIYDSRNGNLIIDIPVTVTTFCAHGLAWSDDGQRLFVVSDGKIKEIQVSSGTHFSNGWLIHDSGSHACIALSKSGDFVAYSSNRTLKFLESRTGLQLCQSLKYHQDVHSIALSSDNRLFATSTEDGKIAVRSLKDIISSSGLSGPFIHVGAAVLDAWEKGQLSETEALLTEDIALSGHMNYSALANRALVRTRLRYWNAASDDAEKSIRIQPSVIAFVAKGVALVGGGRVQEGYRMCDFAFKHCDSDRVDVLLAIKAVVACMAGEHADAISRVADLISAANDDFIFRTLRAYMHSLLGNSLMKDKDYEGAIQSFEHARVPIQHYASRRLRTISLIFGWRFDDLDLTVQRNLCEALCAAGRVKEAEDALIALVNDKNEGTELSEWISSFTQRCLLTPQSDGASAPSSPHLPAPRPLLVEWARTTLTRISWKDALVIATGFTVPRMMTYRTICERLEMTDLLIDAIDCFRQMVSELALTTQEDMEWVIDFHSCCGGKFETAGDIATDARRHDDAIMRYSASLSLCPTSPQARLAKRSKVYIAKGLWREALRDADEIIELDPSSPLGYERRHAALWGEHRYEEAKDTFRTMLMKMSESPDPRTRVCSGQYVMPEMTGTAIGEVVRAVVTKLPLVLINTTSGRLCDHIDLLSMFESQPIFTELVTTTTTQIDRTRIEHEVAEYYRYATLSHTWERNEPLFKDVTRAAVYDLEKSFTHEKLQMFCKIARDAGLHWAWSDTCCIDKENRVVLQEALVAMFKWYQGSALTVVSLRGVRRPSRRGDLLHSAWNTRAWTLQEYHASRAVRFYTEDWALYLDLDIPNHKESSEIISEMEEVTGISENDLEVLQPGLDHVRDKLRLASKRNATRVEDKAYCLLGIFSASLPLVYGEGEKALGRLLAHILTNSGDSSILAWTGKSGAFNTCFPADISAFSQFPASHVPLPIKDMEMDIIVSRLCASSLNISAATKLHDRISDLPASTVVGKRIAVPCIVFEAKFSMSNTSNRLFQAKLAALGAVKIWTTEDLSQLESVFVVHPWIDFLLGRQPGGGVDTLSTADTSGGSFPKDVLSLSGPSGFALISPPNIRFLTRFTQSLSVRFTKPISDISSLSPSRVPLVDKRTEVLRFIARLRQPFGPLLFASTCLDGRITYRRIAADSLFKVQIRENTPLNDLAANVQVLDVL